MPWLKVSYTFIFLTNLTLFFYIILININEFFSEDNYEDSGLPPPSYGGEDSGPSEEPPSSGGGGGGCEDSASWCSTVTPSQCYNAKDTCCVSCKKHETGNAGMINYEKFSIFLISHTYTKNKLFFKLVHMETRTKNVKRWWPRMKGTAMVRGLKNSAVAVVFEFYQSFEQVLKFAVNKMSYL